jgi:hypothetical protein
VPISHRAISAAQRFLVFTARLKRPWAEPCEVTNRCSHGEIRQATYPPRVGLFRRLRGLDASHSASSEEWTCLTCGAVGLDDRGAEDSGVEPTFEIRGQDRGKPVRKCFACGGGFLIVGRGAEQIPAARWQQMEAFYAEQMRATEERFDAMQPPHDEPPN